MRRVGMWGGWLMVVSLTFAAGADEVRLQTGDVLKGQVVSQNAEQLVLDHPVLGKLMLPMKQVAAVQREAAPAAVVEGAAPAAADPEAQARAAAAAEAIAQHEHWFDRFRKEWKSRFEMGASITQGNSESVNLYLAANTKRENKLYRTKFDAGYNRASKGGDVTQNEFTFGAANDWLIPDSRWFWFANGRYEYDDFESWRHRLSAAGGIGHETIKTPRVQWLNRMGLGAALEIGGQDDEIIPEGFLGTEFNWKITDSQTLALTTIYYPDLTDPMEFRLVSTAEWIIKFADDTNVSLKVGLKNEYESEVDPNKEHNDLKIYSAIVVDF